MKNFILDYLEDILIIIGLVVVITATFFVSFIAGLYVMGITFIGLGAYFTRYPIKKEAMRK